MDYGAEYLVFISSRSLKRKYFVKVNIDGSVLKKYSLVSLRFYASDFIKWKKYQSYVIKSTP